jgi:hypothetical protein
MQNNDRGTARSQPEIFSSTEKELSMETVVNAITTLGSFDVQMFDPQVLDPVFVIPIIIIVLTN